MIATFYPITSHADKGVFLNEKIIKDEKGQVVKTYYEGDKVKIVGENDNNYILFYDHKFYEVEKSLILKTHIEKEEYLSVSNDAKLRIQPSFFSYVLDDSLEDQKFVRISDVLTDYYWVKVKSENGLIGYIYIEDVISNNEEKIVYTRAFLKDDFLVDEHLFKYGEDVKLFDYENGKFSAKIEGDVYRIDKSFITFQQPPPKIRTPSGEKVDQLDIYGDIEYITPVNQKYPRITSRFGPRWGRLHGGTDVGIPIGTPIYAVKDGIVVASVNNQTYSRIGYGNYIKINHGTEETVYAHLNKAIVSVGEEVKQGQLIGFSGNSGHSFGPHLHFELIRNGKKVDSYFIVYQPYIYR